MTWRDFIAPLVAIGTAALEEVVKHPIGTATAVFGLLYVFDRWRTQRISYKIKKRRLDHEESIRDIPERK